MCNGILDTLSPFMAEADGGMSTMILHMLRRFLERASLEQLVEVVYSASGFVESMRPFLNEVAGYDTSVINHPNTDVDFGHPNADSGTERDGSGSSGGSVPLREVDPISTDHPAFLEQVQRKVSGTGSGYEAPVERDSDSNGLSTTEAVS